MTRRLRIGTRGSALARWQADRVAEALARAGTSTEIVEIRTTGDLVSEAPISQLADPALFTRQLDEAMLEGRIDLAVHSLKDLPTALPEGITLAAVSAREDARDALVSRSGGGLADLASGAVVATSSLRRRAQLLRARPDLDVVEIRGNVDTRLAKVERDPGLAATVLAAAGLIRLGLGHRVSEWIPLSVMLPAPGQAALAVTARSPDSGAIGAARDAVHDMKAALAVAAERSLLASLGGGCEVPVAAFGELLGDGSSLVVWARVVSLDGQRVVEERLIRRADSLPAAEAVGAELAARLVEGGAEEILEALRAPADRGTP